MCVCVCVCVCACVCLCARARLRDMCDCQDPCGGMDYADVHAHMLDLMRVILECRVARTHTGSRCAGAYSISTEGMAKALLHLPMWCAMDWMFNGAKHAPRDASQEAHEGVRTKVLFLEPALFREGSKLDPRFATTMTGCEYCPV